MGLACWTPSFSAPRKEAKRRQGGSPLEPRMVLSAFFLGKPPQRGRLNHPLYKKRLPPRNQTVAILLIYDHPPPVCIWLLQITGTGTVFIERKSRVLTLKRTPARPLRYRVIRAVPDGYGIHTFRRAPRKLLLGQKGGGPAGWFFGLSARSATSG